MFHISFFLNNLHVLHYCIYLLNFLFIAILLHLLHQAGVTLSNLLNIFSTFYMLEIFDEYSMDKNLLYISLTKFNKLNKRSKRIFFQLNRKQYIWFLISKIFHIAFDSYLAFIFRTFLVYIWRVVWFTPVSVLFFDLKSNNVSWIACAEELKIVCFYTITFIFNMVALIFFVLAE